MAERCITALRMHFVWFCFSHCFLMNIVAVCSHRVSFIWCFHIKFLIKSKKYSALSAKRYDKDKLIEVWNSLWNQSYQMNENMSKAVTSWCNFICAHILSLYLSSHVDLLLFKSRVIFIQNEFDTMMRHVAENPFNAIENGALAHSVKLVA